MLRRALLVVAVAVLAATGLVATPATAAPRAAAKVLDFHVKLEDAGGDVYDLPGGASYGRSRLIGTTTWGRRGAAVDWMCSHVSTDGSGATHDLVTITRSDGAVLALSIDGWVTSGVLRGTVSVIGGKGAYRGVTGTGTVVGRAGKARLQLTVVQPRERAVAREWGTVGC